MRFYFMVFGKVESFNLHLCPKNDFFNRYFTYRTPINCFWNQCDKIKKAGKVFFLEFWLVILLINDNFFFFYVSRD